MFGREGEGKRQGYGERTTARRQRLLDCKSVNWQRNVSLFVTLVDNLRRLPLSGFFGSRFGEEYLKSDLRQRRFLRPKTVRSAAVLSEIVSTMSALL